MSSLIFSNLCVLNTGYLLDILNLLKPAMAFPISDDIIGFCFSDPL